MFTLFLSFFQEAMYYVGYMKGTSFLSPLSKEEESEYIEKVQHQDKIARDKLIEHNLRLVAHIVKKYDIKKEMKEDLISIGTIGLIKAIDTFKPDKGHKLTTYASRCIENEILMYLRSSKNNFQNISLNEPIASEKDGSEITLIDAISIPEKRSVIEEMMLNENINQLKKHLNVLDERELIIITKRFGLFQHEEQTQREIASELKISRSYVSRIEKRAFMKLFREFKK